MKSRLRDFPGRFRKRSLTVRSKVTLTIIFVALTALFIIGYFSWHSSRTALRNATFNQLTGIRSAKAREVEGYFRAMHSHVRTLTEDATIIAAMVRFNRTFRELEREPIPPLWDVRLETYYEREYFPKLTENLVGTPAYDNYRPRGQAATYLQYYYITTNINPTGAKGELDFARDGSSYSDYHADYHPWLRNLIHEFDYYDLFLIDFETGDIIYSVEKEVDFATNILTGPYQRSGLADVVRRVQSNPARYAIQVVDFQFYQPSLNVPAAFIAGPIYNGPHVIGILAFQFPLNELDAIVTGAGQWREDGLGETGKVYLIGADYQMRSQSRLLLEDPDRYRAILTSTGVVQSQIDSILQQGTPILRHPIRTEAATAVLAGNTGTLITQSRDGRQVLSAFTPLQLEGLSWALIAEIDALEAFAPITALTRNLIIVAVILVVVITFLSLILTSSLLNPLLTVLNGMKTIRQRDEVVDKPIDIYVKTKDEFGELARTFNQIVGNMQRQQKQLVAENREYLGLLMSNLPDSVVERFRNGERRIIEQMAQATVLFVHLSDYTDLMTNLDVEETALLLNELDDSFHDAAKRHDLLLFKLIGQQYVAVCGLISQRLDHARRAVDLAISMRNTVNNFNLTNDSSLAFHAGIDSGSVMGGIIGQHTFSYDLWGNAVRLAQAVKSLADSNEILITEDVQQQVESLYHFTPHEIRVTQFGKEMDVWRVEHGLDDRLPSVSATTAEATTETSLTVNGDSDPLNDEQLQEETLTDD